MDLNLTDTERAFREEVRAFLAEALPETVQRRQRASTGTFSAPDLSIPWLRKLSARGWGAPLWPPEYGGTGWTPVERFIFEYECALAGAPLVHPMGVRLIGPVLIRFGTAAQKAFRLPRILSGEDYWCQGYSEPNAGSDLASLSTTAVRAGDRYVLNGSKIWTTHAHHSNMMFLLARTSHDGKPREGISFLILDMASPGVTVRPILSMSGEHELNQVFFDEVDVPVENLVGTENGGWECAKYLLEFERGAGLFSARLRGSLNRIQSMLDQAAAAGRRPLDDPLKAALFAEVAIELDVFEMLELRTSARVQSGDRMGAASSVLKLRASRMRQAIGHLGVVLLGADALRWQAGGDEEANLSDLAWAALVPDYLTSRAGTIYGGASEVQLGIIARSLGV